MAHFSKMADPRWLTFQNLGGFNSWLTLGFELTYGELTTQRIF